MMYRLSPRGAHKQANKHNVTVNMGERAQTIPQGEQRLAKSKEDPSVQRQGGVARGHQSQGKKAGQGGRWNEVTEMHPGELGFC